MSTKSRKFLASWPISLLPSSLLGLAVLAAAGRLPAGDPGDVPPKPQTDGEDAAARFPYVIETIEFGTDAPPNRGVFEVELVGDEEPIENPTYRLDSLIHGKRASGKATCSANGCPASNCPTSGCRTRSIRISALCPPESESSLDALHSEKMAAEIKDLIHSLGSILNGTEFDDRAESATCGESERGTFRMAIGCSQPIGWSQACACQDQCERNPCRDGRESCDGRDRCVSQKSCVCSQAADDANRCPCAAACRQGLALLARAGCCCGERCACAEKCAAAEECNLGEERCCCGDTCACGERCGCGEKCTCGRSASCGGHSPHGKGTVIGVEFEELQSQRDTADENCTEAPPWAPLTAERPNGHVIDALRAASRQLETAANLMEQESLYYRADQLRELAGQLRSEARSAQGGWTLQPLSNAPGEPPPGAQRDLHLEIEALKDELKRTREALNLTEGEVNLQR